MLKDIYDVQFLNIICWWIRKCITQGNFSNVCYTSFLHRAENNNIFRYCNLKGKTAAEITDVVQKFFTTKSLRIDTILFTVLDGTNSMSGKKNGLQRRRYYSPFSIYINCRNHRLALSLPHLMEDICLGEILKTAVTHWLTHGRASEHVLYCLLINTNESEVRGYRNLLMDHKVLFFICLMVDILKLLNTLSLSLQKQGALLVDIKHIIRITLEKL